ncbi:PREDICTED: annexin D3-like [Ipomoea nil]|uniref:annexin D3-like n=1 Tax=Ipomoea nil TaxID=35883 RepID=UPI000901B71F|nr:PREDICTED: annexin D3-like [Ipomoea nil]
MATLRLPELIPSPTQDCETLMKAFKGLGTEEKEIVRVLGHRNASQRKQIREAYQQLYNKSLIDDLSSELSGDFMEAVILWTYDPPERDARLVNKALKSTKEGIEGLQVIVEIACASSPEHLAAVKRAYCSLFDCSIEEDITESISLPLKKVLVGLVSSYRYDKEVVDIPTANLDAAKLHEAIQTQQLDNDDVVFILCARNVFQLRASFLCYEQNYQYSIDHHIKSCGEGPLESILKLAIWCIDSPAKHFAEVLRASVLGLGTDEDSLTRTIVTRAEIDLAKVRGEYDKITTSSGLDQAVADDTSGDYKDFLMTLLGAEV